MSVASPCSTTELISPVSQSLNRVDGDEYFHLDALSQSDLEYSLSPQSTISFATSSPEEYDDSSAVDNSHEEQQEDGGTLQDLTLSKNCLLTVTEEHSVVVESSYCQVPPQYLERDLQSSGSSAIEYCEIEVSMHSNNYCIIHEDDFL